MLSREELDKTTQENLALDCTRAPKQMHTMEAVFRGITRLNNPVQLCAWHQIKIEGQPKQTFTRSLGIDPFRDWYLSTFRRQAVSRLLAQWKQMTQ